MISLLTATTFDAAVPDLAEVLHACVQGGASVNFLWPFSPAQAQAFWLDKVRSPVLEGRRLVLVARADGRVRGTVALDLDTPPNQPHRADVSKLLVHPDARRQGMARALLAELERQAKAHGRCLLTLDTVPGDVAFPLYRSVGYQIAGEVPGFALSPDRSRRDATCYLYKALPETGAAGRAGAGDAETPEGRDAEAGAASAAQGQRS